MARSRFPLPNASIDLNKVQANLDAGAKGDAAFEGALSGVQKRAAEQPAAEAVEAAPETTSEAPAEDEAGSKRPRR